MFFPEITGWQLLLFILTIILVGGFLIYVALPWLWAMFIKPGILWIILTL